MGILSAPETVMSCAACGASIYPEHLDRHLAGYWAGALYCSVCLVEKKNGGGATPAAPDAPSSLPLEEAGPGPAAVAPLAPAPAPAGSELRPPRPGAKGASRMRIFHARLSDGAIAHLDQQVNDWLEQNPDVEIKFANTAVGTWEGKHPEPNLILALFY